MDSSSPTSSTSARLPRPPRSSNRSSSSRSTHELPSTPTETSTHQTLPTLASHLSSVASTSNDIETPRNPASTSRLTRSHHHSDLFSTSSSRFSSNLYDEGINTSTPTHRRDASTSLVPSASTSFTPTPTRRDSLRYTPTASPYSFTSTVLGPYAETAHPRTRSATDSPTRHRRDASPAALSLRGSEGRRSVASSASEKVRARKGRQDEVDTASLSSGSQYSVDERGIAEGAGAAGGGEQSGEESDPWMGVDLGDDPPSPPRSPLLAENVARMARIQSFGELGTPEDSGTQAWETQEGGRTSVDWEGAGESQAAWGGALEVDEDLRGRDASWRSRSRSSAERSAFSGRRAELDGDERGLASELPAAERKDVDDVLGGSEEDGYAVYLAQRGEVDVDYGVVPQEPLVTSASEVGLALGWNASPAHGPSTSSYQPVRPSTGTPPVSPHRQVSPSRHSHSDHLSVRSSASSTSSLLRSGAISTPLPRSQSRSRSPTASSTFIPPSPSTPHRPAPLTLVPRSGARSSSRTSSRGVLDHQDGLSPASAYSSRPSTPDVLASPTHDNDPTPVRHRLTPVDLSSDSIPSYSSTSATAESSAPTLPQPTEMTSEPDHSLFLEATPSTSSESNPSDSSVLLLPAELSTEEGERRASTEERRAEKPRRELPLYKAKSSRRSSVVARSVAVDDKGVLELPSGREAGEGEDQSLSVSSSMREMSLSELGGLRASGSTPLSASDFADAYGDFHHSPSPYDSELPHTHSPHYNPPGVEAYPLAEPDFVPSLALRHAISESPLSASPPTTFEPASSLPPDLSSSAEPGASPAIPDTFFETTETHASYASSYSIMEELDAQISHAISHVNLRETPSLSAPQARSTALDLLPSALGTERPTSQAVSDVSNDASNDVYHDAPMARGPSAERAVDGSVETIERRSAAAKSDAKARAAAFIADLKRAKAAAAALEAPPMAAASALPSPSISVNHSPQVEEDLDAFADSVHATPVGTTRILTDLPALPTFDLPAFELSPLKTPTGPPSNPSRSVASTAPVVSLPRAAQIASHALQNATTGSSYDLSKLSRRRPLPAYLQYGDLRKAKSAGERAKVYARKINALSMEESGLDAWIGEVKRRGAPRRTGFSSPAPSPQKASRRSREDPSNASSVAFPVRNDGFRAKEIPFGQFGPGDMAPTVPYPGVLQASTSSVSSRYGGPAGKPPSAIAKSSFFSTLSRKGSKRSTPPSQRSQGGYVVTSPLGTIGVVNSASGLRPAGPRMPGTTRSSLDLAGLGGSTSNLSPPQLSSRASFTYGSLNLALPATDVAEVSEDKLQKLVDILPQADRETLRACLARAGNDDVLAISLFLSEEQNRRS